VARNIEAEVHAEANFVKNLSQVIKQESQLAGEWAVRSEAPANTACA
jgi:hypothetical protein